MGELSFLGYTEEVALSGLMTITGRTSGETE
jgi:hypothetical protein